MEVILFFLQEHRIEELTRRSSFSYVMIIITVFKEKILVVRKNGFRQVFVLSDQGIPVSMRELALPRIVLSSKAI